MKHLHIMISSSVFFFILLSATTAQAADDCDPAYAVRTAEMAATARASTQAAALTGLIADAKSQKGDAPSVKAKIDARYAVAAAGGLAQDAYLDTARSYFCFLKKAASGDAAKLALVTKEEKAFRVQVIKYFDPGLWQLDAMKLRSDIGDALVEEAAQLPLLPRAFVSSNVPNFNFDTVKLFQITADATFNDVATAAICGGLVKRSIKRVSPTVLANLQNVRSTIVDWMSGDRAGAKLDMWTYTASQMSSLLASSTVKEEMEIKPETIACLEKERDASILKATPPSTTPTV